MEWSAEPSGTESCQGFQTGSMPAGASYIPVVGNCHDEAELPLCRFADDIIQCIPASLAILALDTMPAPDISFHDSLMQKLQVVMSDRA